MVNILGNIFIKFRDKTYEVNTKEQQKEYELTKNLYTLVGFKNKEDLEGKITKETDKLWKNCKTQIDKDKSKLANVIKKSSDSKYKLNELLNLKNEAVDFLKKQENERPLELNDHSKPNPSLIFHEISLETLAQRNVKKKKLNKKTLTSNKSDFERTLEYINSLEKVLGITLEEWEQNIVKNFLSVRLHKLSSKKHPTLHDTTEDAIKILSDSELRGFYNQNVEKGTLPLIVSYKECKTQFDKVELETIDKLVALLTQSIDDINENKISIFRCKKHQNEYMKEKETFEHRDRYCQNMIDILQENIQKYQKEIDSHFNPVREKLNTISSKTRYSHEMREFLSKLDNLQTNHGNLLSKVQINEEFKQILTCPSMQNKTYVELEKTNPSGNLSSIYDLKIQHNKSYGMITSV